MSCIKSFPKPYILDKHEALGDHLFNKIAEITQLDSHNVGKITGILLDENESTIYDFLQDVRLLNCAIEKILPNIFQRELPTDPKDYAGTITDEEMLYDFIHTVDSENCAKLTGMILELGQETVKCLLNDRKKLQEAVDKASSAINSDQTDAVGELVYTKIEKLYPQVADKVTGMLLKLGTEHLRRLLKDDVSFKQYAEKAHSAITSQS